MKLSLKLAVAILPGALAVIAAAAVLEVRRNRAAFDADQRADDLAIARGLAVTVGRAWEDGGVARAMAVLEPLAAAEARFRMQWIDLGAVEPHGLSRTERDALKEAREVLWHTAEETPARVHALSPVLARGVVVGAIDVSEAAQDVTVIVRRTIRATIITTVVLGATMVLVTLLVGGWVVGRPVSALIEQAHRVAAGDLSARSVPRHRDELGELTRELNRMLDRLQAAAAEVRASTRETFAALEQLRHAERLTTVGRLASSVAHELGTPLNIVAGRARLIVEDERDAAAQARIIIDQAERMTKIVRQLLDYGRRRPSQKHEQDLRRVTEESLALLGTLGKKKRIALRFASGVSAAPVIADPTQIQQAIANLVVNAIQASVEGAAIDVRLELVRARRRAVDGGKTEEADFFELSVKDHGAGMSRDVLTRVFEPFFTTKPVGEATGLGLSVAHDIAGEHGGWIDAESEPGRGSRFSLYVPGKSP